MLSFECLLVFVTFNHYISHNFTLYIDELCSSDVLFGYLMKRYSASAFIVLNLFKVYSNFILHINQNLISRTSIMQKFSTYTRGLTISTFIIIE